MPRIINAYDTGQNSIASGLKSLGDSMFSNEAQHELIRQHAYKASRENENIPLLADAVARGDRNALARYGVMAGKTGADTSNFNLLSTTNNTNSIDDPRVALAQIGAHESISATPEGQRRQLAQQAAAAHEATTRAAATQEAIAQRQVVADAAKAQRETEAADRRADREMVNLQRPDGMIVPVPRSQVPDMVGKGYHISPSLDQVKAGYITGGGSSTPPDATVPVGTTAGSPPTPTPAAAAPAPVAPPPGPTGMAALDPDKRAMIGVPHTPNAYQHPTTGETATSMDHVWARDNNGRFFQIAGSGFMPSSAAANITQAQQNRLIHSPEVTGDTPALPDPSKSAAASDARTSGGALPAVQAHANKAYGAIPGVASVGTYLGGGPEVAPGVQNARTSQNYRNNEARSLLAAPGGRISVQAQKWVDENLPQTGFVNPETEAKKIPVIVNALQQAANEERATIQNINTPAKERTDSHARLSKIIKTMRLFTQPAAEPPPAAAAPQAAAQPAPAAAAPESVPSATGPNGQKIYFRNGQWGP